MLPALSHQIKRMGKGHKMQRICSDWTMTSYRHMRDAKGGQLPPVMKRDAREMVGESGTMTAM